MLRDEQVERLVCAPASATDCPGPSSSILASLGMRRRFVYRKGELIFRQSGAELGQGGGWGVEQGVRFC